MSYHDLFIIVIIGGVFLLLGFIGLVWGRREEGAYYNTILGRIDVREFWERLPGRPEPHSLRVGGRICLAVGTVLLLISLGFYLWGMTPQA